MSRDGEGGIFVKEGNPVRFFLHNKLKDGRDRLIADIEHNGGEVVNTLEYADTVLIDERKMDLDICRKRYYNNIKHVWKRHIFVEPRNYIRVCLSAGRYWHKPPRQLGMDGRPPNRRPSRVAFTHEDDENLCHYIATRIPDKDSGGRQGQNLYKDLWKLAQALGDEDDDINNSDDFEWVLRHSWQSWRERYIRRLHVFDRRIEQIIAEHEAEYNEEYANPHGIDHRDRRNGPTGRHIKVGAVRYHDQEEEEEEEVGGEEEREVRRPAAKSASMSRSPPRPLAKKRGRESETSRASHAKRQRLEEEDEVGEEPIRRKKSRKQGQDRADSDVELPRSTEEARARARAKRKAGYIEITDDEGRQEDNAYSRQGSEEFPIDVDADPGRPESPVDPADEEYIENEDEPLRTQATLVGTPVAPRAKLPTRRQGSPARPPNTRGRRQPVEDGPPSSPRAPSPTLVERSQRDQRPLPRPRARRAAQVPAPEPEQEEETEADVEPETEAPPQFDGHPRTYERTARRSVSRPRSRSRSQQRQPRVPPTPRVTRARSRSQSQARAPPPQTAQGAGRVTRARSRSQSQEPQSQAREQVPVDSGRGRGRGRAAVPAPALEDIRESPSPRPSPSPRQNSGANADANANAPLSSGSGSSRSARIQTSVPPVETLGDDEKAVENLLVEEEESQSVTTQEDESQSVVVQEDELKQEDVDSDDEDIRTPSDSDDARTHRVLHPHPLRASVGSPTRSRASTRLRTRSPLPIPPPLDLDSDSDEDSGDEDDKALAREVREAAASARAAREREEQASLIRRTNAARGAPLAPQHATSASASASAVASSPQRRRGMSKVEVVITTSPHSKRSQGKPPSQAKPPSQSQAQQRVLRSGATVAPTTRAEPEFPSPGTRAREVREGMEEALDALPYVPPENTRAARALRSRNV